MLPVSYCPHVCAVPSHMVPGLVFMTNSVQRKWWYVTSKIRWSPFLCLLDHSLKGNHGISGPIKGPLWQGTEVSCQQPCKWASRYIPSYTAPALVCVPVPIAHITSDGLSLPQSGYKRQWCSPSFAHQSLWRKSCCVLPRVSLEVDPTALVEASKTTIPANSSTTV